MQKNITGLDKRFLRIALLFLSACASRINPTGGDKDITPPVLTEAVPENNSVNFSARKIILTFDEQVQLADLAGQLVISPLMEPAPKITALKNKITIELPDTLRENTTYLFSFGKAVVDVHESNALNDFRYVFSTGPAIDSFTVKGFVKEAATLNPAKEITVMLYRSEVLRDTNLLKRKPDYFTRTDVSGVYSLNNLAAGCYVILALDDKNGNYRYDDPAEEALGFTDSLIVLPPVRDQDIYLSMSLPETLRLKRSTRIGKTAVQLVFNRPVENLQMGTPSNRPFTGLEVWNSRRDSLYLFMPDTLQDSLVVYLSAERGLKDTVAVKLQASRTSRDNESRGMLLRIAASPAVNGISSSFVVESGTPLMKTEGVEVLEDSVPVQAKLDIDSVERRRIAVRYAWLPGKSYRIKALPGAITDRYGYVNDSLEWKFQLPDERTAGELQVKINGRPEQGVNYLLQLCTEDFKVLQQVSLTDAALVFPFLNPGSYRLRVVKDQNGNGRWDESDFPTGRQAEKVTVSEVFQVRSSWTLEKEIVFP